LILLFLRRKIAETHLILAQNITENNAYFNQISYIFIILILIFSARKKPKTRIISFPMFGENKADIKNIRNVF
jgi:hypothetical protein